MEGEYGYESDRKAWVRYPPPRWIWDGTAICGIPSEVSRAMMRGWHGHNGVLLVNPRLGFVCTMQTTDGQPGLEGYFYEYDHDLEPNERLRFAPEEVGALVVRQLRADAARHIGRPVTQAVLAGPGGFGGRQSAATRRAARRGGLEVLA